MEYIIWTLGYNFKDLCLMIEPQEIFHELGRFCLFVSVFALQ
jgi:hypothetical protein